MKVDRFEGEMRQDPMRKKLLSLKNYFSKQQEAMKAAEADTEKAGAALGQLKGQYETLRQKIERHIVDTDEKKFESAMQVRQSINEINDMLARLQGIEQRLDGMMRSVGTCSRNLRAARANAAKAKTEYSQIKSEYDKLFADQSRQLAALTAERDKLKPPIPAPMLRKYESIKKRCSPPMAALAGDKCGGCNMALPAVIVSNARKGGDIVECETCGRIIYIQE